MNKHMCVKASACPPAELMSLHGVFRVAVLPGNALPAFDVLLRNVTRMADRCPMRCQFAKDETACAPMFWSYSLGCFGGTAAVGEHKRNPSASSGKQIGVNDVHLEMVPFLFSVPGQYSRAGI